MTPQEAQAQLERAKGSPLSPDELSTAQRLLTSGGWTTGSDISDEQFQMLLQRGRAAWGSGSTPPGNSPPNNAPSIEGNVPGGIFSNPNQPGNMLGSGGGWTPSAGSGWTTGAGGGSGPGGSGTFRPGAFAPPSYPALPPLDIPRFQAPSMSDALNDQGYQFAVGQGQQRLENAAAARGLLRTGGTLKDLIDYGQSAGTTQYGNVFNRNLSAWSANNQSAMGQYALNTARQNNIYAPQFAGWQTGIQQANTNADRANALTQQNYQNQWNQYLQQFLQSQWNQRFPFEVLNTLAGRGAG